MKHQNGHDLIINQVKNIVDDILIACKTISREIRFADVLGLQGEVNKKNSSGDDVKTLDVVSDTIIADHTINASYRSLISSYSSEESHRVNPDNNDGFMIFVDPLDGSSNIKTHGSVGTIFSIERNDKTSKTSIFDREILAAGYVLYGPQTVAVITIDNKTSMFMLDESGFWIKLKSDIKIPTGKKTYSFNDGFFEKLMIRERCLISKFRSEGWKSRYIGSMVADVHRLIIDGGFFMYPATFDNPQGKLRLHYECRPIAYIIESCGGKATASFSFRDSKGNPTHDRILDKVFLSGKADLHSRSPIYIGDSQLLELMTNETFETPF